MRTVVFPIGYFTLILVAACAPKVVPLPTVTSPRFPDFIAPVVPAAYAGMPVVDAHVRGWTYLQAGDLTSATREFSAALKVTPAFYPAEIGLGYVELADRDEQGALEHFDRALARQPADPSALVGRGEALLGLDNQSDAVAAFEAAAAVDPSLTEIARRVEVLKFRVAGQRLTDARTAAAAGRIDDAIRAYTAAIESSPGSAFLYRELAGVERQRGDTAAALAHFRTAFDLDPADAGSVTGIGELLEAGGDFEGAEKAYSDALAIEPSADLQGRVEGVRAKAELARLPAEYRAIGEAPQITRGELAALIGVRLGPLLQPDQRADAEPITDARTDWAATWILAVARAGVMEPFANHAFQPRTVVRRTDLAQAVERLLTRTAALAPARAKAWETARVQFADLAPGHLAYPAASAATVSGVLTTGPDGRFEPSRIVSGREATEAIERIEALAGLTQPGTSRR
jgi:tetratricopeptide (TPR) repeat protein